MHDQCNWGFGLCYLYLRDVKCQRFWLEPPEKALSCLLGAGVQSPYQTEEAVCMKEARVSGGLRGSQ